MAIRIAVANHKGGVAKSTSTLMIAEGLALHAGYRVLVIDMDPQCSVSSMLLSTAGADRAASQQRSLSEVLLGLAGGGSVQLSKFLSLKASDLTELRDARDGRRVDLLASNRNLLNDLGNIEAQLRQRFAGRLDVAIAKALAREFERIDRSYDVIVFDCPAGTGPLALAAVRLSQFIIAPSVLDSVSIRALRDFLDIVLKQDVDAAGHVVLKVLPSIYRTGDPVQKQMLDVIRSGSLALNAFPHPIPDSVHVRRAVERIRSDSYRDGREKYGALFVDTQQLAADVVAFISRKDAH